MELNEKLFLLDNIIDYLYYNFKTLREKQDEIQKTNKTKRHQQHKTSDIVKVKKLDSHSILAIRLARKGIRPSLSIDFKKAPSVASQIGNPMPQRDIKWYSKGKQGEQIVEDILDKVLKELENDRIEIK